MKDHLGDFFNRIHIAGKNGHDSIMLAWPTSQFCVKVLDVLQQNGYIRGYKKINYLGKIRTLVLLKTNTSHSWGVLQFVRISKPGDRHFGPAEYLWNAPSSIDGVFLMSTSQGIMLSTEARQKGLGGELLAILFLHVRNVRNFN